jgi:dTDP-glucose 4,6-dehydratase
MTRVLVTGASGFIGSHLVEALVGEGCTVRVNHPAGEHGNLALLSPEVHGALEVCPGDVRDPEAMRACASGVDAIFHLGAITSVPYANQHPQEAIDINVGGTLNVLLAARQFEAARVVVVSTCGVYGALRYSPVDELHPARPQSPYAASKLGAEALATSFYHTYGLPVAVVRPFNTYGPCQSQRAVVPTIISQALARPVVELGALHPRRDLTYVSDTVAGLLAAWRAGDEALGAPVNLGTGQSISIGELAQRVIDLTGRPVEVRSTAERTRPAGSEPPALAADNALALERLKWKPLVSLDEGLRRTIDWVRDHMDRFAPDEYRV